MWQRSVSGFMKTAFFAGQRLPAVVGVVVGRTVVAAGLRHARQRGIPEHRPQLGITGKVGFPNPREKVEEDRRQGRCRLLG